MVAIHDGACCDPLHLLLHTLLRRIPQPRTWTINRPLHYVYRGTLRGSLWNFSMVKLWLRLLAKFPLQGYHLQHGNCCHLLDPWHSPFPCRTWSLLQATIRVPSLTVWRAQSIYARNNLLVHVHLCAHLVRMCKRNKEICPRIRQNKESQHIVGKNSSQEATVSWLCINAALKFYRKRCLIA